MKKSGLLNIVAALALGAQCAASGASADDNVTSRSRALAAASGGAAVSGTPDPAAISGKRSTTYSARAPYYILSVAFDAKYDSRISNGPIPTPVLLLSEGIASFDPSLITVPTDIDYDRQEHPENWPSWRRANGQVQILEQNSWQAMHYPYEVAPLAANTALIGTFEHRRDSAVGTTAASAVDFRFRFYANGTYEFCESTIVIIPAIPTIDREYTRESGTYTTDGYTLTLNNTEGGTETMPLFYDPERPTRLWLGVNHYPNPSDNLTDICRKL